MGTLLRLIVTQRHLMGCLKHHPLKRHSRYCFIVSAQDKLFPLSYLPSCLVHRQVQMFCLLNRYLHSQFGVLSQIWNELFTQRVFDGLQLLHHCDVSRQFFFVSKVSLSTKMHATLCELSSAPNPQELISDDIHHKSSMFMGWRSPNKAHTLLSFMVAMDIALLKSWSHCFLSCSSFVKNV